MQVKRKLFMLMILLTVGIAAFASCGQDNKQQKTKMNSKKTLVVFFSRTGENYAVGNIKKGNTHVIADMIAQETDGDIFQIVPVKAYPDDYTKCTEVAKREADAKARPAVKDDVKVDGYDVIFVGYPNWWGDMPMPVYTFIEKHKWQGKTVIPFCTHEGSGLGSTASNLKSACKGATVLKGLAVRGAVAQKEQDKAKKSVDAWLKTLGLTKKQQ